MTRFVMSRIMYNIRDMKGSDIVDNGYMQEMRNRILSSEDGTVFVAPDFADMADTATIRQGLQRYGPISATAHIRLMSGIPQSWNLSTGPIKKLPGCPT